MIAVVTRGASSADASVEADEDSPRRGYKYIGSAARSFCSPMSHAVPTLKEALADPLWPQRFKELRTIRLFEAVCHAAVLRLH